MVTPTIGDWVAAVYDKKWYVGKVLEVDSADGDAYIWFMEASRKSEATFKMPSEPDEIWIKFQSILAIIEPPSPCGKTRRQYKFNTDTVQMITQLHSKWPTSKASKGQTNSKEY